MAVYGGDTSVVINNSTTLVDVPGAVSAELSANTVYYFEVFFIYTTGVTPDLKVSIAKGTGVSDAEIAWSKVSVGANTTVQDFATTVQCNGVSGVQIGGLIGTVTVGTNVGTIKLQAAQNTANASDTTVFASIMEVYPEGEGASTLTVKPANETRTSTTTMADDDTLVSDTLAANSVYKIDMYLLSNAHATPDIKWGFGRSGLSDADIYWSSTSGLGGNPTADLWAGTDTSSGAAAVRLSGYSAILITGSDPGTVSMQWAQAVSSAENTTVLAGSTMRILGPAT